MAEALVALAVEAARAAFFLTAATTSLSPRRKTGGKLKVGHTL